MKNKILILQAFFFSFIASAQSFVGTWKGELDIQGTKLPLVFHISKQNNAYTSTLDSPMQGAKGIPIETTTVSSTSLEISAPNLNLKYKAELHTDAISGNFEQNGLQIPLTLTRVTPEAAVLKRPQTPKPPFDYSTEEVSIKNLSEGNLLSGTLTLPKDRKDFPILVFITGSGPQNRDEELFGHKPFLVIADYFAKNRIGSLRMDDRGVGGSGDGKPHPTSLDFAGDINSAVEYLVSKGYKNIGLLGHSEGGMTAPIVASKNKNVKFIISLAGPGVPINDLMYKQNESFLKLNNVPKDALESELSKKKKMFDFIHFYKGNTLKTDFEKLLTETIKPSEKEKEALLALTDPWYAYFLQFNPENYWSKVKVPVLALNGSLDIQVDAKQNLNGIRNALAKVNNKFSKIEEIPQLNHLFQTAKTGNVIEYAQIEETFAPAVLEILVQWIQKLK